MYPSPRGASVPSQPISVPSSGALSISGRGRGRGVSLVNKGPPPAPPMTRSLSQGVDAGRSSGASMLSASSPDVSMLSRGSTEEVVASNNAMEKLTYLEGLVPGLNKRIEDYERQIEGLNAELEDLRQQLAEQKAQAVGAVSPGRTSKAESSSSSSEEPSPLQRRPTQGWVGTLRRTNTSVTPLLRESSSSSVPLAASPSSSRSVTPLLGGRRKEHVDERGKAVERLIDSERKYSQRLNTIVTMYLEPMRHVLSSSEASKEIISDVFSNVEMLLALHKLFLAELLNRWSRWSAQALIGDVIAKFIPLFALYQEFFQSGCGSRPLELDAGPDAARVRQIISQADANATEGNTLQTLLGGMRSRIREYVGFLVMVVKVTETSHADYDLLIRVRTDFEDLLKSLERGSLPTPSSPGLSSSVDAISPSLTKELSGEVRARSASRAQKEPSLRDKHMFSKTKGGTGKRFKDKKEKTAYEIQQRILADIQEREKDPNLSEEERGKLKIQAAYAAQGKFEAALQVMAGRTTAEANSPSQPSAEKTEAPSNTSLTLDDALKRLMEDSTELTFEKTFLSMYFYFISWRDLFHRLKKAYQDLSGTTPDQITKRNRIIHLFSVWLETNPHLRHMKLDDGPKKKKRALANSSGNTSSAAPAPASSPRAVSPRKQDPGGDGPRSKPLPKPPLSVIEEEDRVPDETDGVIVARCNEIIEAIRLLEQAIVQRNDQGAMSHARSATEMTMKLSELVQSAKEESEPTFVDEMEVLRGSLVSLTQKIVLVIKCSFSDESCAGIKASTDAVATQCSKLIEMAQATKREVEVDIPVSGFVDEDGLPMDDDSEVLNDGAGGSIIEALLTGADEVVDPAADKMRRKSEVYKAAMNTNASVHKGAEVADGIAPIPISEVEGASGASFVESMDMFCNELPRKPAEQAFIAFYSAWKSMGTAEENFRKTAHRKSVNLTKGAVFKDDTFTMDLLKDVTAVKVAQQMAILEYQLFQVIPTAELFLSRFMEPEKSPNFAVLVNQFNIWGRWAYSEVLRRSDVAERAKMISFFVTLAKESLAMNNFNTSYAIVAGLNFPGLSRLKQTWQKVSKKDLDHYESLLSFWNTSRNYKSYRTALKAAIPPAVPWFGLVAKDLFHIEDSSPTLVEESNSEKVNFNKLSLIWNSVSFLNTLQKYEYQIKKDPSVQRMLSDVKKHVADENEGMSLSYKYEPKVTQPKKE